MSGAIWMELVLCLGVGLKRGIGPKVGSIPGESACVFNPVREECLQYLEHQEMRQYATSCSEAVN